ncbi:hypothetical protein ACFWFK_03000, partial [Micromonospora chalcea]
MAMTEAFASTAAQTIPVFAFAATVEVRYAIKRMRFPRKDLPPEIRAKKIDDFVGLLMGYGLW